MNWWTKFNNWAKDSKTVKTKTWSENSGKMLKSKNLEPNTRNRKRKNSESKEISWETKKTITWWSTRSNSTMREMKSVSTRRSAKSSLSEAGSSRRRTRNSKLKWRAIPMSSKWHSGKRTTCTRRSEKKMIWSTGCREE